MRKKVIAGLLLCAALVAVLFYARLNNWYSTINTQTETWTDLLPKKKDYYSILLMGYGGAGHEGAYLTDTMMIIRIDTKQKKVIMVSIPRDIWVRVPTKSNDAFFSKINSVYQMGLFKDNYPDIDKKYGGKQGAGNLIKEVVDDITGEPNDYYIAIDFNGFVKAIDTLGGVEITVQKSFSDPLYPATGKEDDLCGIDSNDEVKLQEAFKLATESPELAFPCRYEKLYFGAGKQVMDGETALKFVRSRHSPEDGGDFGRARRQQLFLEAVKEKILSIGFISKILPLMEDLEENIRMDIPLEITQKLIKEVANSNEYSTTQMILTTDNYLKESYSDDGQYILIPRAGIGDWDDFKEDYNNLIEGGLLSPTPAQKYRTRK